jgi:hypothetical protein
MSCPVSQFGRKVQSLQSRLLYLKNFRAMESVLLPTCTQPAIYQRTSQPSTRPPIYHRGLAAVGYFSYWLNAMVMHVMIHLVFLVWVRIQTTAYPMDVRDKRSHTDSGVLWSPIGYVRLFVLLTEELFILYTYKKSICLMCSKSSFLILPSAKGVFVAINKSVMQEKPGAKDQ